MQKPYIFLCVYVYVCVCMLRHAQIFATLWIVTRQSLLSMGFFQARILEWVAISFYRGSS